VNPVRRGRPSRYRRWAFDALERERKVYLAALAAVLALMASPSSAQVRPVAPPTLLSVCGAIPNGNSATQQATYNMCVNTFIATREQEISNKLPTLADQFQVNFYFMQVVCVLLGLIAGFLAGDF
jgi:hypothetical protein